MDPTVIIGVVLGIFLVLSGIGIDTGLKLFVQPHGAMIVFGGVMAAALVHFPFSQVRKIGSRLRVIFIPPSRNYQQDIMHIVQLAEAIRKDGRLAANKDVEKLSDHFLRDSLQLFIDKVPPQELEAIMQENLRTIQERHDQGVLFFEQMAKYAPGFGLLATLIALVLMLSQLDDPQAIGPAMAVGLVGTFYGVFLANLVFLPLAGRLRISSNEEIFQKEMMPKALLDWPRVTPLM